MRGPNSQYVNVQRELADVAEAVRAALCAEPGDTAVPVNHERLRQHEQILAKRLSRAAGGTLSPCQKSRAVPTVGTQ